ncbi:MAG: 6-carboxytetrahydropterin synthase [Nitrospirae bacterium]|nr:6-carboxytetrahydropterin synthase [Nitrospirota bacterium]
MWVKGGEKVWLTRRAEFSAAHYLTAPGGRADAIHGEEARRHGHNYLIELTVAGPVDAATGMVVNMSEIKRGIAAFSDLFDHKSLNDDTAFFADAPPTVEAFASVAWGLFAPLFASRPVSGQAGRFGAARLARLRLWEDERTMGEIEDDAPPAPRGAALTRVYRFSASHRLNAPGLSEAENERIYGRCNNPRGHGHDYALEVTVQGTPDPGTGRIVPVGTLDDIVSRQILGRFDRRDLNDDMDAFGAVIPTAENILRVCWGLIAPSLPAGTLYRLRLVETRDNYFEYYGPEI